jgi:hypothetical protein
MGDKLKPALIGGAIVGVLSLIPILNLGCCIWAIIGGAVAVYMYVKGTPRPVQMGEGAVVGALAGLIGALITIVISFALSGAASMAMMEEQFRRNNVDMPVSGMALMVLLFLIMGALLIGFSAIGGVIGVSLFEKRKGGTTGTGMPPPPPAYGGGQPGAGGGYGANQ